MQSPCSSHWISVLDVIRYLKGTLDHDLLFRTSPSSTNEVSLVSYSNANWEGDVLDRKSIYGHYILLNGNPIAWSSKKQWLNTK